MRKIYFIISLFFISIAGFSQSLLVDDFTGLTTASNLAGQSSWTKGGSGPDVTVQNTTPLTYPGYNGGGGEYVSMPAGASAASRVYKSFTTTPSGTNTFYYSFLLNLSAVTSTGDYFITLGDPSTGTAYFGRIFAKSSGTGYNLGVTKLANVATAAFGTTVFDLNQTYLVVVRYSFVTGSSNDEMYVWVNPSLATEPTTGSALVFAPGTQADPSVSNVGNFHWHNRTVSNPSGSFDGVRVAYGATSSDAWTALNASSGPATSLSISSALPAFGNVCINTTTPPNSFTISGSNLTTANVTVAALNGYTYSTTSGGTYSPSLSLTQPGGSYTQQVFVKFTPTAVQSYNGNITVAGGGATGSVDVAASGAGVNNAPAVTTGAASAVTSNSATAAGSIPDIGCSAITAYGIEYSTTSGFANGSGTQAASTNISGGNFTSNLGGLAAATIYYYKAYATNSAGTTYGTQQSFTTTSLSPSITTTALTGFGNVCINTAAGPNSFTITGSNLTTADVTVGPLAGYTFSTTTSGTYTASLTLTQPGGSYSQQVFVKLTPVAVQSYNGNIPVNGGGTSSTVNVAVTGAGVNSAPSVTTGASSAITTTTATLAGSITATGCSAVTAYGIEYSTTNGFADGSGTKVASTNLAGGNFSSSLSGLTASTTYYYKAYATNGGGTAYGTQQSFTTLAPPPPVLTATTLAAFAATCANVTAGPNSFIINGTNLTTATITIGPLAGYTFATTAAGTYTATLTLNPSAGTYSQQVFVKFTPAASQSYNGNIPVSGAGAATINVAATGSGVNTPATVVTGAASGITNSTATLAGDITASGCATVTAYGIEYSGINGFANGNGTKAAGSNIAGTVFSVKLSGLVQGATYYYKAYATTAAGTAYGAQQTFTVLTVPDPFIVYPVPVQKGTDLHFSMNKLKPGYYGLLFFNSDGKLVHRKDINIQGSYINQAVTIPGTFAPGAYRLQLVNNEDIIGTKSILIY